MEEPGRPKTRLRELALVFLRLGATSFGGPAAHIALMESELVDRRRWLSRERFLDLFGATNLIPGPNSTELAIHLGRERGGPAGLVVAGVAFILPGFCAVLGLAWVYVRYGALPSVQGTLDGIKPVVLAVVAQALWSLGRSALKTKPLAALGLLAAAGLALGLDELVVIFGAGLVGAAFAAARSPRPKTPPTALWVAAPLPLAAVAAAPTGFSLGTLFFTFLKVGSVLFGSGYVLLAFLRADFVERLGWLDEAQILDAVAVGQMTPGPLFTAATFVGFLKGGAPGAVLATIGIFLPAFVFVALTAPLIPKLRGSRVTGAFLDAVNVGSLAAMAVVSVELGRAAIVDVPTAAVAGVSAVLLVRFRVSSAWLVLAGAAFGLVRVRLR